MGREIRPDRLICSRARSSGNVPRSADLPDAALAKSAGTPACSGSPSIGRNPPDSRAHVSRTPVIPPGPVRRRDEEVEFLLVDVRAIDVYPDISNENYSALPPRHTKRPDRTSPEADAAVMITPSAPMPPGQPVHTVEITIGTAREPHLHSKHPRKIDSMLVNVYADDTAAVRSQHLGGELPKHAETQDHERLTERRRRPSDPLQRDRAQSDRAAAPLSIPRRPAPSNSGPPGCTPRDGRLRARTGDPIADVDVLDPGTDLDDRSCRRVARSGARG